MSWRQTSNELIDYVASLFHKGTITKESKDEICHLINEIQEHFVNDLESTKTHYSDNDVEKLKKEIAELQHDNTELVSMYEGELSRYRKEAEIFTQEAGKYRKEYKRAKDLVVNLTKFIAETEDED